MIPKSCDPILTDFQGVFRNTFNSRRSKDISFQRMNAVPFNCFPLHSSFCKLFEESFSHMTNIFLKHTIHKSKMPFRTNKIQLISQNWFPRLNKYVGFYNKTIPIKRENGIFSLSRLEYAHFIQNCLCWLESLFRWVCAF